ncbi:hypothetical protein QZH41_020079, partial [Actinostola sp. cb2023]
MQAALRGIIEENIAKKINFVILKCLRKTDNAVASQLLPIDPRWILAKYKQLHESRASNVINVNILLLDSVSRAHFYRSLPQTIDLFKTWSKSPDKSPAQVFDFELFQALEGHTAINTHALFAGKLFEPFVEDHTPPVEIGVMFGHFVKTGYQTLWQEDLCWKAVWGLVTDLGVNHWKELDRALRRNFIDSLGASSFGSDVNSAGQPEMKLTLSDLEEFAGSLGNGST